MKSTLFRWLRPGRRKARHQAAAAGAKETRARAMLAGRHRRNP
jgi:hypothetical protein